MKKEPVKDLYIPELEHDACGIGFLTNLKGRKTHATIADALIMLENMEHRGGCGCEPETGDGAGILFQLPHQFLKEETSKLNIALPEPGKYGVGMVFFPAEAEVREQCKQILQEAADKLNLTILGYRELPVSRKGLGATALANEPNIEQLFVVHQDTTLDADALERKLYVFRNYTTHTIGSTIDASLHDFYFASLSARVIVYKGQLRTDQVKTYYLDLQDERVVSSIALVHSRFSTNTFPKWKLAQPFRFIAHNGEINTIRGNVNKMKTKEVLMESSLFTKEELNMLLPICDSSHSDSANFDSMVELLVLAGRSLPHALMMMVPEAWEYNYLMTPTKKDFYKYHASLMEPWDGPASICFTDGKIVGAMLDRNGLRPSRYCVTEDGTVIMASEAGALPVDQSKVISKGRLQPGKMFLVDLEQGRIISDEEIKEQIASRNPYREWLRFKRLKLRELLPPMVPALELNEETLLQRQQVYGYSAEDLKMIVGPMAESAKEPVGSMGADTPLAVLSTQSQHLSNYFKQLFAQVSNPPIDPIRERMVMSLFTRVGMGLNILDETPEHCKQVHISQPVLSHENIITLKQLHKYGYRHKDISIVFAADGESGRLEEAVDRVCAEAEQAIADGYNILVLTDRNVDKGQAPMPSLLATGAVQHHLIRKRIRTMAGIVVEAGDVWETHNFATLIGFGASAVHPYMAFETILSLNKNKQLQKEVSDQQAMQNYIKAVNAGLLKIMSKMGISTLQSYQGSQIFECLGLGAEVINKCFEGTISRIGGIGFDGIAKEVLARHRYAFPQHVSSRLPVGGFYQWKRDGEFHLMNPETIHLLQYSTKRGDYALYKKYAQLINDQSERVCTLRSLLDFKQREAIPLEEVEPVESIMKRFATGAMSFGSISYEAHSTLAIAMNRIGAKSNSGEGGEDEVRFERNPNGDWERSAIKQVASGRFGVTSYYLTNADELQIKVAQGAKPGEGGQLPGDKVDDWIAKVRHSTPGVGLISPPPHHDIYSIEDLAQLIFDLKNANREARINVKLVSEAGVGTVAAGVAKAKADVIMISGHDGGTGASPISSIRHAGIPWELGLAEAHQTLVKNNLRSRVTLQTDGQIRTGRDLAIATLLGAEEWGVATAALIVEGCIMMRKCHQNTCPVGVATQNPELRALFTGKPEDVVNLFNFLAEDMREIMASLGFRTVDEMVGQADVLKVRDNITHWKIKDLNLAPLVYRQPESTGTGIYKQMEQDHVLEEVLDWKLIDAAQEALENATPVQASFVLKNTNRSIGVMLSNEVSKRYKGVGLPADTIHLKFRGSAGQTFGGFAAPGLHLELEGEANDYFGKGLSGGHLVVYPDKEANFKPEDNIIIGNVALYGATSGEVYINGMAGERFAVRNSGANAVVEGAGDHACEYMTGGVVVVLGPTGRNFAAGMSGGVAFVYDPEEMLRVRCNTEMVDLEQVELEDHMLLRQLLENQVKYTGSQLAQIILDNWEIALASFTKVMPREYKAVLSKKKNSLKQAV
ncbi:glutamate synthase large subunit [Pontibacter harenae]|uniref:glutamate synthase large subunit n=1 Tax=Pontibacter harenae TaxID=2894083 RepID=UPI001E4A0AD2|nr:glutamate synthase large subunit [Pontibacter harenae]MCC9165582.1 glutamate synthase large subunit [Pontibacter harenae]